LIGILKDGKLEKPLNPNTIGVDSVIGAERVADKNIFSIHIFDRM
jgi:hypothetical protein